MSKLKIKISILLLAFLFINLIASFSAHALTEQLFITVKVNGNVIKMDSQPYMKNNTTLVSIRFVAEALSEEVQWIAEERKAVITEGDKAIELYVDSTKAVVNGEEKTLVIPVEISNNRMMIPLRFIAENMDCIVDWDEPTLTALIYREGATVPASSIFDRPYTDEDIIWLSRIIHVEGRGLSVDAKVAIANVVLNRKNSAEFPGSIYDVIFDDKYGVQFPPAHKNGFRELVPNGDCIIAAKMALEGINNIDQCLFFNHRPFQGKENDLFKVIEGEYFYY